MSRPSFQFYTKDWRSNSKLRRCSPAARGVWVDVLCALHDSDEYGIARYPLRELAQEVGASMAHLRELVDKGVLKGGDREFTEPLVYVPRSGRRVGPAVTLLEAQPGPLWFSSRMVKDEHVRTVRGGEAGRFGAGDGDDDGDAPKPAKKRAPIPPNGDGSSTATATAVSKGGAVSRPASARALGADPPGHGPGDPQPPGDPPGPSTEAGLACRAIRAAGVADANPGHPDLLRLLDAGVTAQALGDAASELAGKGRPRFALLLATVEGRLRDAAAKGDVVVPDVPWDSTGAGIIAMGERLGVGTWTEDLWAAGKKPDFLAYTRSVRAALERSEGQQNGSRRQG